jgi:hypothetical protein
VSRVLSRAQACSINQRHLDQTCTGVCSPTSGTEITVATAPVTGPDFQLRKGGRVEGRLTDASTGQPIAGVSVSVLNGAGTVVSSMPPTNAQGQFGTTAGIPAGDYYLRTGNSQGYINQAYPTPTCCA